MRASLQQKIAPPVPSQKTTGGDSFIPDDPTGARAGSESPIDFKSMLMRSNRDTRKERQAQASGDLSGAKTYEDFLEQLNQQTEKGDAPKNNLDKNDFLKLFVTQLQAQDPLNPKDGAEMASQLAQFNSLEQMMNMNTSMDKLAEGQTTNRSVQLLALVGKEVSVDGGTVHLKKGGRPGITAQIKNSIGASTLEVRDGTGTLVRQMEMGPMDAGEHDIKWDGTNSKNEPMAEGKYTISILAKSLNGEPVDIPVTSRVQVTGIDLSDGTTTLFTEAGPKKFTDIKAFGEVGFETGKTTSKAPPTLSQPNPVGQPPLAQAQVPSAGGPRTSPGPTKAEKIPMDPKTLQRLSQQALKQAQKQ